MSWTMIYILLNVIYSFLYTASKYWVVPEKCEAFGGTTVPKNYKVGSGSYVELWNYEK